jgi:hypothetical protein
MHRRLVVVWVCLLAPAVRAAPRCELRDRPWLEGRVRGSGLATARSVDARAGEELEVFLVAPGVLDGRRVEFSEAPGRDRVSWAGAGCGRLAVSWRRVEPRKEHQTTAAPNRDTSVYSNAVLFGPTHGTWIGFDRIEYFETPIEGQDPFIRVRDARPSDAELRAIREPRYQGLGVMRLAATVRAPDGVERSTAGAGDAPGGLIADRVFRYTFRDGDGLVGWLTSFFNVPYLFGSAGRGARSQAERYLGADCADILVAALRRAGLRRQDYSSVGDLVGSLERVARPVEIHVCNNGQSDCVPSASPAVHFNREVRPGDLLALDYIGADDLPRAWDHVVMLIEDRGPDGKPDGLLGPEDLVADSGSALGLKFTPLGEQGTVRAQPLRARGTPALVERSAQ